MKQLTNYQRATNYLVKVFKLINEKYFDNTLDIPTITIQSKTGTYGHITVNKVWSNNEVSTHELNICADYLNRPVENIVATLIHEACHLYALQNNIQDTSNRGIYHNKRFKKLAEERGLYIEKHNVYGWTITEPTEETLDFCIDNNLEDIQLFRQSSFSFGTIGGGSKAGNGTTLPPTPKKSSTRKYICPCCGNSFRATKNINVLCMDCDVQFELA